jgi:hypothetical protein
VTGMGIDVDGGLASTHLMFVKRGLADKWREQGWLLKNSLATKSQKLLRVRKLYKRFSPVSWTFSITRFSTIIRKTDFFNNHRDYH